MAFPDAQVQILPYNRVVQDLAGMTPGAFMDTLRQRFIVTEGPASPARKGEVAMFLDGHWHTIVLGDAQAGARIADRLDVMRLQDAVLAPMLESAIVRTDKRIDFVGGARGTAELESRVALECGGGRVLLVPGRRSGSDGHHRRRRDHAAEVHLVRAQAPRRVAVAPGLAARYDRRSYERHCHADNHTCFQFLRRPRRSSRSRCSNRRSAISSRCRASECR